MKTIKEADWKILRELRASAIDRYCEKLLQEASSHANQKNVMYKTHSCVRLEFFNRRRQHHAGFGDLRRSNALERLAFMKAKGIITTAEMARFSEETQERVSRFEKL